MIKLELTEKLMYKLYYPVLNQRLGITTEEYNDIIYIWKEPHRFYHGINHLKKLLAKIETEYNDSDYKDALIIAAYFHDLIYFPMSKDNEEQSYLLYARSKKLTESEADVDFHIKVRDFILSTKNLQDPKIKSPHVDNTFWLIDNSVLIEGSKSNNYLMEYEQNIRKEYPDVPDKLYREKRILFLQNWLSSNDHLLTKFKKKNIEGLIYHLEK